MTFFYLSLRLFGVPVRFSQRASHCKDEPLAQMRKIAHAEDTTKFNGAVNALKELSVWNQTKKLRDWFLGIWLKQCKVLNTSDFLYSLFLLKQQENKER